LLRAPADRGGGSGGAAPVDAGAARSGRRGHRRRRAVIPVLWSGPGLLAVDKPPGMALVPGRRGGGSLPRQLLGAQLGRPVWIVHRLDRATPGVLRVALDAETHRAASQAFESRQARKRYLALVWPPLQAPVRIDVPLVPARRSRMRVASPEEDGKAAVTELRPLETHPPVQLVEPMPLPGSGWWGRCRSRGPPTGPGPPLATPAARCWWTPSTAARSRSPPPASEGPARTFSWLARRFTPRGWCCPHRMRFPRSTSPRHS